MEIGAVRSLPTSRERFELVMKCGLTLNRITLIIHRLTLKTRPFGFETSGGNENDLHGSVWGKEVQREIFSFFKEA